MVYVPSGSYKMGASDEDIRGRNDATIHTVQLVGFYMFATEISNQEYRPFTNWVRDSIAHTQLQHFVDNEDGSQKIDWKQKINWKDQDVQDQLMNLYIPAEQSGWGKKEFDNSKLVYKFRIYDYEESARNPDKPRTDFITDKTLNVYPDTTVWIRQFNYSNNEPIAKHYNSDGTFNEYPVVGVNYFQAKAFAHWRTLLWKNDRESRKQYFEGEFDLPNESQWEWAARGGRELSPYPWGGPYIANQKGCYLANFKPGRGDYAADGGGINNPFYFSRSIAPIYPVYLHDPATGQIVLNDLGERQFDYGNFVADYGLSRPFNSGRHAVAETAAGSTNGNGSDSGYLPRNLGRRFSRNAVVPSCLSSES